MVHGSAEDAKELFDSLKIDLNAQKLGSFEMILGALTKVLKHEVEPSDKEEIETKLKQLKKCSLVTTICTSVKKFFFLSDHLSSFNSPSRIKLCRN